MSKKNQILTCVAIIIFTILLPVLVKGDSEIILRPNNDGDLCGVSGQYACSGCPNHYVCVNDNNLGTFIWESESYWVTDLYNLPDISYIGEINKISLCVIEKRYARGILKTYENIYETEIWYAETPTLFCQDFLKNPYTNKNWTFEEINNLQIGVRIKGVDSYFGNVYENFLKIDYKEEPSMVNFGYGGGGYYPPPPTPPPGGFSVVINNGATETESRNVTLTLNGGPDAIKMVISNFSDFRVAQLETYQTTKTWVLSEGEGEKAVYVKFYNIWDQPSDVASDAIILIVPPPSPLSPEAQRVDVNKDNKIDIFDFDILMANWGTTIPGNIADFNGDGMVDLFDFNLLMVHWTV